MKDFTRQDSMGKKPIPNISTVPPRVMPGRDKKSPRRDPFKEPYAPCIFCP